MYFGVPCHLESDPASAERLAWSGLLLTDRVSEARVSQASGLPVRGRATRAAGGTSLPLRLVQAKTSPFLA